jgi:hypothetical protein
MGVDGQMLTGSNAPFWHDKRKNSAKKAVRARAQGWSANYDAAV